MFTPWYETDNDCCQHMRHDGTVYEMIQAVWLDTTRKDKERGLHEYCVVQGEIDLNDFFEEEMECYIHSYGYTMDSLKEEYGDDIWGIVAECILEESIMCDSCVVADMVSRKEAEKFVKTVIELDNTKLM